MSVSSLDTISYPQMSIQNNLKSNQILLVEDEDLIRDMITLALEKEGYKVSVAADGRTALNIIQYWNNSKQQENTIDLIILDVMLPYLSGLDLCRTLRSQGNNTSILMLSAKSSELDRILGLELGADDYLPKPFGMKELLARCKVLLRHCQPSQPNEISFTLRFKDVVMYPMFHRVIVRGQDIKLSPKEFSLLQLFMCHPHRLWTRDQLIHHIWGTTYIGDNKTIDVHIHWLREKLEINPTNPEYIRTEWGIGYRFG